MRVGGARQAVVYGGHPLVQEAVRVPVHRARQHDDLADDAVDLAVHAEELVGVGGAGGLVEAVYEVHVNPVYAPHSVFTSLSLTLE